MRTTDPSSSWRARRVPLPRPYPRDLATFARLPLDEPPRTASRASKMYDDDYEMRNSIRSMAEFPETSKNPNLILHFCTIHFANPHRRVSTSLRTVYSRLPEDAAGREGGQAGRRVARRAGRGARATHGGAAVRVWSRTSLSARDLARHGQPGVDGVRLRGGGQ